MSSAHEKLLKFIEEKNLLSELKEYLNKPEQTDNRFKDIEELLGVSAQGRANGEELKRKFVAFMEGHKHGKDAKEGVHTDEITEALYGTKTTDTKRKAGQWIKKSYIVKVEGKKACYYYKPEKSKA